MMDAVALAAPFTVAAVTTGPVNVDCKPTPGWVGTALFNKVGKLAAVVGKLTVNALVPKI